MSYTVGTGVLEVPAQGNVGATSVFAIEVCLYVIGGSVGVAIVGRLMTDRGVTTTRVTTELDELLEPELLELEEPEHCTDCPLVETV